jgi:hypothetical protein
MHDNVRLSILTSYSPQHSDPALMFFLMQPPFSGALAKSYVL